MGQKKGIVPKHIQNKTFRHPGENSGWFLTLNHVEDPRKASCNTRHSVISILFIIFIAVLCGAKNWEEIYHLAEGLADWLSSYVDISSGIPSKWTLERVFCLIPTKELEPLFKQFAIDIKERGTVAIDGKTLRGSRAPEIHPLHLLHAWSVEEGICLGQVSVDEKSNEITAFPLLLAQLKLKGTVVTTDALNTQKKSAAIVIDKEADYIFPVKENHSNLLEEIKLLFADANGVDFRGIDAAQRETVDKRGGRVEIRNYTLLSAEDLTCASEWKGCHCIGRIIRKRSKGGKESEETCYYITSLNFDIEQFAKSSREHWGVENGLHWSLDVIFKEDHHRYQQRVGAANLSLMRKIALMVLTRDKTLKCGRATKQVKALASSTYRDYLLKNCF